MAQSKTQSKDKNSIQFDFLGEQIPLKFQGDSELIEETIKLAEMKVKDLESRGLRKLGPHRMAIVGLLEIAEDYIKAKRKFKDYRDEVKTKTADIINTVDGLLLNK